MRSAELTLPGFVHDVCSAIHPLAVASPFFRDAAARGARPRVDPRRRRRSRTRSTTGPRRCSSARSEATGATLGEDAGALARGSSRRSCATPTPLLEDLLAAAARSRGTRSRWRASACARRAAGDGARPARVPRRAGARRSSPGSRRTRCCRSIAPPSAAVRPRARPARPRGRLAVPARRLAAARRRARLVPALARRRDRDRRRASTSLAELGDARAVLLDVTPRQLARARRRPASRPLPPPARALPLRARACSSSTGRSTGRSPGAPRSARAPRPSTSAARCDEIAASERDAVAQGDVAERPFVLLAQQSLFDPTRAPAGQHTAWAYCHVPNGSTVDMTERIEAQVERFAPGFRERILARSALGPAAIERHNANYVGGDINGGAATCRSSSRARSRASRRTRRRSPASSSARRRRRPAAACTGCAASTPRGRRCARVRFVKKLKGSAYLLRNSGRALGCNGQRRRESNDHATTARCSSLAAATALLVTGGASAAVPRNTKLRRSRATRAKARRSRPTTARGTTARRSSRTSGSGAAKRHRLRRRHRCAEGKTYNVAGADADTRCAWIGDRVERGRSVHRRARSRRTWISSHNDPVNTVKPSVSGTRAGRRGADRVDRHVDRRRRSFVPVAALRRRRLELRRRLGRERQDLRRPLADVGKVLRVNVTAKNSSGTTAASSDHGDRAVRRAAAPTAVRRRRRKHGADDRVPLAAADRARRVRPLPCLRRLEEGGDGHRPRREGRQARRTRAGSRSRRCRAASRPATGCRRRASARPAAS